MLVGKAEDSELIIHIYWGQMSAQGGGQQRDLGWSIRAAPDDPTPLIVCEHGLLARLGWVRLCGGRAGQTYLLRASVQTGAACMLHRDIAVQVHPDIFRRKQ